MRLSLKRKFFVLVLSFALANIALYSIVNFHQYRIFGKELSKIDKYFTKKDDKKYLKILVKKINHLDDGGHFDFSCDLSNYDFTYCFPDKLLIYSPNLKGNFPQLINNILPIRGSPNS